MHRSIKKTNHLRRRARHFESLEQRNLLATLADPGFENPVQPVNEFEQGDGTGNGTLVGSAWTFSDRGGITRNTSGFQNGAIQAPEGNQFALLQRDAFIEQLGADFDTNTQYVLTLSAAIRAQTPTYNNLRVLVDGVQVFAGNLTNIGFQNITTSAFTPTSETPLIRFETTNPTGGDQTVFIDNILILAPNASLQNAGFESPDLAPTAFRENNPPAGWTGGSVNTAAIVGNPTLRVTAGAGIVENGSDYGNPAAPEGTQAALLKSTAYMEQTFNGFVVGNSYAVHYQVAPRTGQSNNLSITIDGAPIGNLLVTGASVYTPQVSSVFFATAESMTLRFETSAVTDQSIFLDDVVIDEGPVADPNGPYTIGFGTNAGQTVTLDGSASFDPNGDLITDYSWDIDNDGFADFFGPDPELILTGDDLDMLGITALGTYPITLTVTANGIVSEPVATTLTISNTVIDGDGNLVVYGTEGSDRIVVSLSGGVLVRLNNKVLGRFDTAEKVIIYAQGGADTISLGGSFPVPMEVYGGAGNDYIASGSGNDTLVGGAGNDRLLAGAGHDFLYGGELEEESIDSGNDSMSGGLGNDTMYGGDGNDNMSGDLGNDIMYGEDGNDRLYGVGGNDIIRGGFGINYIDGGAGNDILIGGADSDRIFGQQGMDLILGGASLDYLYGGSDTDLIVADESTSDTADDATLQIILDQLIAEGASGDYSADFNDMTVSNFGPDTIYGQGGADVIFYSTLDRLLAKTSDDVNTNLEATP